MTAAWWRDPAFTLHLITAVYWRREIAVWEFVTDGARTDALPTGHPLAPKVGDLVIYFPTSKAGTRGCIVNETLIRYRSARQHREYVRDFWLAYIEDEGCTLTPDDCRMLAGVKPWPAYGRAR